LRFGYTGPGIPEAEQEAIFEEFRRGIAETSGADVAKGTGLDLAILAIVRHSHPTQPPGQPVLDSRVRYVFSRACPTAATQAAVDVASQPTRRTSSLDNRLVPLLENDPEIVDVMPMLFQRWNCPPFAAACYEALCDFLEAEEARAAPVDCRLHLDTAIDGLVVIDLLRQDDPGLPDALV